jgi:hypothetical protein
MDRWGLKKIMLKEFSIGTKKNDTIYKAYLLPFSETCHREKILA